MSDLRRHGKARAVEDASPYEASTDRPCVGATLAVARAGGGKPRPYEVDTDRRSAGGGVPDAVKQVPLGYAPPYKAEKEGSPA